MPNGLASEQKMYAVAMHMRVANACPPAFVRAQYELLERAVGLQRHALDVGRRVAHARDTRRLLAILTFRHTTQAAKTLPRPPFSYYCALRAAAA